MNDSSNSTVDGILQLFRDKGDSQYGGECVTQLEHALQAAALAEGENASAALIAAALLHDLGHLLHDLPADAPDEGIDDVHERAASVFLQTQFPSSVTEPVRLHVAAKRYLCAAEPGYLQGLSQPSLVSLKLQGGPMDAGEQERFRRNPHWQDAVRLRRWDDAAKLVDHPTPDLEHFASYLRQAVIKDIEA